jgi:hypothetical protein
VDDPDLPEIGFHTYTWYVDGVRLEGYNESSYTFDAGFHDAGNHVIKVEVTDPTGLMADTIPTWTLTVKDVNRMPLVYIDPPEKLTFSSEEEVVLTCNWTDPDGDEPIITWYLITSEGDEVLATGPEFRGKLPAGEQTVEVEVDDGKGGKATNRVKLDVEGEDGGGLGTGMLLGIVAIVIVVVVIAVLVMYMRGGKPDELEVGEEAAPKMDFSELERDYDPRPDYGGGEYRELDK